MSKEVTIARETTETKIKVVLNPYGTGRHDIDTGIGFFDHMLQLFAAHGRFNLAVKCAGDLNVDGHHAVEDVGLALGQAFAQALGDKRGITRYADLYLPMDEALVLIALDLSGRSHLSCDLALASPRIGEFDTQLVEEFLQGLTRAMGLTLHVRQLAGRNDHHIVEALFKGLGRALSKAVEPDPKRQGEIPSTKGIL